MHRLTATAVLAAYVATSPEAATVGAQTVSEPGVKVSGVVRAAGPEGHAISAPGAAVHIRDLPNGWNPAPPSEPLRLRFATGKLSPTFTCLQVGQEVVIEAPKGETFALRAYSPVRGDFGATAPAHPTRFTDRFTRPDAGVLISCAIHPGAKAQIQVVPTPGFVVCDAEGRFVLPRPLPRGEHVLIGFYPGLGWAEKAVTVRGDERAQNVELSLAPKSAGKR